MMGRLCCIGLICITILLESCLVTSFESHEFIYYPVKASSQWSVIHNVQLQCPQKRTNYNPNIHLEMGQVNVGYISITRDNKIPGYICQKTEYVTICEENVLGVQSVKHRLQELSIDPIECRKATKKYEAGTLISEGFKSPSCSWMSTNSELNIEVHVTPHSVLLDPYNLMLIDSIFPSGQTHIDGYETIHKDTVWVPVSEKINSFCGQLESTSAIVYTLKNVSESNLTDKEVWIHDGRSVDKNLEESCRLNYCGVDGIRFSDGEWIHISRSFLENELIKLEIPLCNKNKVIYLQNKGSSSLLTKQLTMDLLFSMRCQETISKMMSDQPISPYDLSFLNQNFEGLGMRYLTENKTILVSHGNYKKIFLKELNTQENLLGHDVKGNLIWVTEWSVDPRTPNKYNGVNGIIKVNKEIILPLGLSYRAEINEELFKQYDLKEIQHPLLTIAERHLDLANYSIYTHSKNANIVELVQNSLPGFNFGKAGTILMILLGLTLSVLSSFLVINYIIIPLVKTLKIRREEDLESIEEHELGNRTPFIPWVPSS